MAGESASTSISMVELEETRATMGENFNMLVEFFLEDTRVYLEEIDQALGEHNISDTLRPSHSIKSSSKQVGALQLSDIAKHMEAIASNPDGSSEEQLIELLPKLKDAFGSAEGELKKILA